MTGGLLIGLPPLAHGQTLLEDQGTIQPAQREYSFDMAVGDVVTILLSSEDFDTVLSLTGPNGEEVAFNDDFGNTLNSRIVYEATEAGSYRIVAKSFDGEGGSYSLQVRTATEYEIAYAQATTHMQAQDYEAAIAAYTRAIGLDANNPEAYLGRADAYFGKTQVELEAQGRSLESPNDLDPDVRAAIVQDYEKAAALYAASGDSISAQALREQSEFIKTGEFPGPTGGGPR